MFTHESESVHIAYDIDCRTETEGLLKVTGCHVGLHCKSGNMGNGARQRHRYNGRL